MGESNTMIFCKQCGKSFLSLPGIFHCSKRCRNEWERDRIDKRRAAEQRRRNKRHVAVYAAYCRDCESWFETKNPSCKVCPTCIKKKPKEDEILTFGQARFLIFKRDDFRCQYCGRVASDGVGLVVEHVYPISKGGTGELSNLVTACEDCNKHKGRQILHQDVILRLWTGAEMRKDRIREYDQLVAFWRANFEARSGRPKNGE